MTTTTTKNHYMTLRMSRTGGVWVVHCTCGWSQPAPKPMQIAGIAAEHNAKTGHNDMASTTFTAHVDVVTGVINVGITDAVLTGLADEGHKVFDKGHVSPWGIDEENMDRADVGLAEIGWVRVSAWASGTCTVVPANL